MRLTREIYFREHIKAGTKKRPVKPGPLGLQHNQRRTQPFGELKGAGWFNSQAEYLGSGDLSAADLVVIASRLFIGEIFVIAEAVGAACIRERSMPDMLAQYASYCLLNGIVYAIDRSGVRENDSDAGSPIGTELPYTEIRYLQRWRMAELLRAANGRVAS